MTTTQPPLLRPPFSYFGGKTRLARKIAAYLPPHDHYIEPFAGSLAVLLARPPSRAETINDADHRLVTFWRVLRDQPDELARRCALTPHARSEHHDALLPAEDDEVEQARRVFVHLTQGRSGALNPTGWRRFTGSSSPAASMPRYLAGYLNRIHDCAERLARVSLECRPALQVIRDYGNAPDALLYLDPPYLLSTQSSSPYPHSMRTEADHRALAEAARACRAQVVISAYDSAPYRELYADWHRTDLAATTHRGPTTTAARTEVLLSNTPLRPNVLARRRPLPEQRSGAGSEAA